MTSITSAPTATPSTNPIMEDANNTAEPMIWVNGKIATDYRELEPAAKVPRKGRLGLQIHSGPPAEARYKNIKVREL